MNWDDMRIILELARTGSGAEAAQAVGVSQATVRRCVAAVEERLGDPLFERVGGRLRPTVFCAEIVDLAEPLLEAARTVEDVAARIRADAPVLVAFLDELCASLLRWRLPDGATVLQPGEAGVAVDVMVGMADPGALPALPNPEMKVRRVGEVVLRPFASAWIAEAGGLEAGLPIAAATYGVVDHEAYAAYASLSHWRSLIEAVGGASLTVSSLPMLEQIAASGAGIALLPEGCGREDGLVPVPCSLPEMRLSVWVGAHPDALRSGAVRAAVEALGGAAAELEAR